MTIDPRSLPLIWAALSFLGFVCGVRLCQHSLVSAWEWVSLYQAGRATLGGLMLVAAAVVGGVANLVGCIYSAIKLWPKEDG